MSNIINYGISETLKALFIQLKETPGLDGNKYHGKDVEQISQNLVCRNYGSVCYELSFLCWAVVNHPNYSSSPLLSFFWIDENIQPKRFRQAFKQPIHTASGQVSMGDDYLQLKLGDIEFAISPTRIGVLAVMLELTASIEPGQLTTIEKLLVDGNSQAIKQVSSNLQKLIYSYLKEHIPEASTQERFRAISGWLKQHNLTAPKLTDQDVLNFWLSPPAQPSYIKYSTVLDDLLDAITAIDVVENTFNADYALSLGSDSEQGEIDAQWVQQTVFEQADNHSDLNWLCQSPKFLTLTQYQPMKSLLSHGKLARQLPLSFLRLNIFAGWQSVLVQAKRKSPLVLADKLQQSPTRQYQDYVAELNDSESHCKQVQQVIAHIFYSLNNPLFVGIMLKQMPTDLQQTLKIWMRAQIANTTESGANHFLQIQQWLSQHPKAQFWLTEAANLFKNNNKDGFKKLPSVAELDIYQDGSEALDQCQELVARYLLVIAKLNHQNTQLAEIYRSDLSIFSSRFKQIYGAPHA
ncbi:hypothetical protein [Paraglaciecola arctica]|uniref:Uncharacterized protein n=1 Tax=Paraglaciecola arctica BSs20135 TaxID=493475 RepID=K6ZCP1_9ALTE|nr:hypothetical protein [Paraglaciecola arctica]GAC21195.1 hypothetical protein GARC_4253 [Paraglaciecola arctica BSs20135]